MMSKVFGGFVVGMYVAFGLMILKNYYEQSNCAKEHNVYTCEKVVTYAPIQN